jgi:uncharacterized protein (TIGR00251 family)
VSERLAGAIATHPDGAVLSVIVVPRAGRTAIERVEAGALRVRVAAAPVEGAANAALLRFLADTIDVAPSRLRLVSGETSRRKRIVIAGVTPDDVAARVVALLAPKPT